MTVRTPLYLKGRFENDDIPQGVDYEDVFDSFLSLAVSAEQRLEGNIYANELNAALVSATAINSPSISTTTLATTSSTNTNTTTDNLTINRKLIVNTTAMESVGTSQASAVVINETLSFITSASNSDNAVRLPTSEQGRIQYITNITTTAVNVYPAVSASFIVTALNLPLSLGVNATMTVLHRGNDRYVTFVGS